MRCLKFWMPNFSLAGIVLALNLAGVAALAQMPDYSGVGKTPSQEEIRPWDIAIGIEGKELPPGSGTAKDGAPIYAAKCAVCHGQNLEGVQMPGMPAEVPKVSLVGGAGAPSTAPPRRTIGTFWPFATTVWDYINRAMPRFQGGSLKPNEVYALTALILYKNGIIKENDVMDANTLPKVQMPNRNGFVPARLEDIHDFKKRGCRLGQCPN